MKNQNVPGELVWIVDLKEVEIPPPSDVPAKNLRALWIQVLLLITAGSAIHLHRLHMGRMWWYHELILHVLLFWAAACLVVLFLRINQTIVKR